MRGRTNVLNFSEEFINADIVEAVADENIEAGNFVRFYNTQDSGMSVFNNVFFEKKLSDGRIAVVGGSSGSTMYVKILERNSSGEYIQKLPNIPTSRSIDTSVTGNESKKFLNLNGDKFAYFYYYLDGSIQICFILFYIDVKTNELFEKTITKNANMNSITSSMYNIVLDSGNYYGSVGSWIVGSFRISYTANSSTSSTRITIGFAFLQHFSVYEGSVTDSDKFLNASATLYAVNTLWLQNQMASNRNPKAVYAFHSNVGDGFFVSCHLYHSQHKLYFVPDITLNSSSTTINNLSPTAIVTSIDGEQYDHIIPFGEHDDANGSFIYFILGDAVSNGAKRIYWFKLRMYGFSMTSPTYLLYDNNLIDNRGFGYDTDKMPVNFSKLYDNNSVTRFYFSLKIGNTKDVVSLLIDVDKNNENPENSDSGLIINPKIEQSFSNVLDNCKLHNVIEVESEKKYTIAENGTIKDYTIVNDSELSGTISPIIHVLDATDENYIMGIAKESGNAGSTIACYKAKVS